QNFGWPQSGELQQLRRVERTAGNDRFAVRVGGAWHSMLEILDADGAASREQNAAGQSVRYDGEIAPPPCLAQIADCGRPPPAVFRRQLEIAGTLLRRAIKVVIA